MPRDSLIHYFSHQHRPEARRLSLCVHSCQSRGHRTSATVDVEYLILVFSCMEQAVLLAVGLVLYYIAASLGRL